MPKHASGMQGVTGLYWPASMPWITTLAEGLGMCAVARVFEVDPNTVLAGSLTRRIMTGFFPVLPGLRRVRVHDLAEKSCGCQVQ
jgi:hypothetical protein